MPSFSEDLNETETREMPRQSDTQQKTKKENNPFSFGSFMKDDKVGTFPNQNNIRTRAEIARRNVHAGSTHSSPVSDPSSDPVGMV